MGTALLLLALSVSAQPADHDAAVARLEQREAAAARDPAAMTAVGRSWLDLGEPNRALFAAERVLETRPKDGDALALKARALRAGQDLEGALAAWKAVPPGHPQAALARVQIRDIEGVLGRAGRHDAEAAAPPPERAGAADGGAGGAGATRTGSAVSRLERAFGLRGRSATLDGTIRNAGGAQAHSLADLERRGIHFVIGPEGQQDAVEVREENGRQIVSVSPSVLKGPREARVAAQFGRGLEEAAAERDYDGLDAFFRKIGGRVKAVMILIELDNGDKSPIGAPTQDVPLLKDRAMVDAIQARAFPQGFSMPDQMTLTQAFGSAQDTGDTTPSGVLLHLNAVQSQRSIPQVDGANARYLGTLSK